MLTETEKTAAKKLLLLLPDEEVMSLAKTITKDQIHLLNVAEAMDAILAFTETAAQLLRRKKLKREILFRYLYSEGISVAPTSDKNAIIRKVLEHWGCSTTSLDIPMDDEDDDFSVTESQPADRFDNADTMIMRQNSEQLLNDFKSKNVWLNKTLMNTDEDQQMALQFSKWFYQMLNACNPVYLGHNSITEHFGPQHFFRDATFSMLAVERGTTHIESSNTSEDVCKQLSALTAEQQLILNPNLDPSGVKGLSDPHGMRVVIVCGTVHKKSDVLGLFEQQFGLVRDPFSDNNWKIKFTRLALTSTHVSSLPTLNLTREMLTT